MRFAVRAAFLAWTATGLAPACLAANATNPYGNVDHRNDVGNDTGDSEVERLNEGQLGAYTPQPEPRGEAYGEDDGYSQAPRSPYAAGYPPAYAGQPYGSAPGYTYPPAYGYSPAYAHPPAYGYPPAYQYPPAYAAPYGYPSPYAYQAPYGYPPPGYAPAPGYAYAP